MAKPLFENLFYVGLNCSNDGLLHPAAAAVRPASAAPHAHAAAAAATAATAAAA